MIKLDRHIEILLLSHDCVIVPGFGGFMTHYVEAKFDTRDNVFLPPLRTLGFNQQLVLNDSLLAQSYVEAYDVSYPEALSLIAEEVDELRLQLKSRGSYEFNDLGILYYSSEDIYTFEPFESGILTPNLYGLNTLELLQLSYLDSKYEQKNERVQSSIGTFVEPNLADQKKEQIFSMPTDEKQQIRRRKTQDGHIKVPVSLIRNIAVACIATLVFFLFPLHTGNSTTSFVAGGLINTSMLQEIMPKDVVSSNPALMIDKVKEREDTLAKDKEEVTPLALDNMQEEHVRVNGSYFTIVLASRITKANAMRYVEELHAKDISLAEILLKGKSVKVVYGKFKSLSDANSVLSSQRDNVFFAESWILKVD